MFKQQSYWNATRRKPFTKNCSDCCLRHFTTFFWTSLSNINVRLWGLSFEVKGREYRIVFVAKYRQTTSCSTATPTVSLAGRLFLTVAWYTFLRGWTTNGVHSLCHYVISKPEAGVPQALENTVSSDLLERVLHLNYFRQGKSVISSAYLPFSCGFKTVT